jgi:hypothetical protein
MQFLVFLGFEDNHFSEMVFEDGFIFFHISPPNFIVGDY